MGSLLQTLSLRVAARFQMASRPNLLDKEAAPLAFRVVARYKEKKQVRSEDGGKTTIYTYSERQIAHRNREKAKRLEKLSKSIKDLRTKVKKDLKSEDPEKSLTALAVALIDATAERVGNEESASGKVTQDGKAHFGVTGWKKKFVSFNPNGAFIKYIGKSGVKQKKTVTDASIRAALRDAYEAADGADSNLFEWDGGKVSAESVNNYIKEFDITAKDIRGYHANDKMRNALKEVRKEGGKLSEDKKERIKQLKDEFKKALEITAEEIGHEASTLRSQYLVPSLESEYLKDGTVLEKLDKKASADLNEIPVELRGGIRPEHFRVLCKNCNSVLRKCRCSGCNRTTFYEEGPCSDCRDLVGDKLGSSNTKEIEITVEDFCRGVWNKGVESANQGVYENVFEPGDQIPWRKIPGNARIKVIDKPGRGIFIQDDEGGWIADRLGPTLGRRAWKRLLAYLKK